MYQIGFIIEQALGHQTHGQNLQKLVPADKEVNAHWGLPVRDKNGLVAKVPILRNNWTFQAGLQARRMVADMTRHTHLDILFFHTQITAVLSPDWLHRYPAVVSLDATPKQYDSLGMFYDHATGPVWLENWKWRLNQTCFHRARGLVTWSQWAKDGLIEEYEISPDKVSVIPPGVDTLSWVHPGREYTHEGPLRILFVGGNLERKGGWLLLKAFREIKQILGDSRRIELFLVTRDSIPGEQDLFVYNHMQPNSSELMQLYHECDIFCLPTYGDCLPMVLSEAGAAGLPIISTNVAAIPEIVLDGETGFLIPAGDKDALKDKLLLLLKDDHLRMKLGRQAQAFIQETYDAKRNAESLLALLKEIVDEPRK